MESVAVTRDQTFKKADLRWVEAVSKLMDSKFVIPGTKFRFGLDPIMSLVPILGDLSTYIVSGVLIYTMYRNGASRKLVIKMAINATLDALMGAIPIIGTAFDMFYKANDRNVRLLKEHYEEGKHTGSGKGILIVALLALVIFTVFILYVMFRLMEAFFDFLF